MNFLIRQEQFEGPLELLLELIENEKLSISEISLARVADDYIRYVKSLEKINPEQLAEFLVVAAELMLIKSKSLLPNLALSEEEEGIAGDLTQRLEEYRRIREATRELKKREGEKNFIFTREAYSGMAPVFYPSTKVKAATLCELFSEFLSALPKIEKLAEERIKRIISIEEKITHIRMFLQNTIERSFSDVIKEAKDKVDVIISFLAILELTKQRFLELQQDELFADITLKRADAA